MTDDRDQPCPFCNRILMGQVDGEVRGVVWFEPLNPVTSGHMLFVPTVHVAWFDTRPEVEVADAISVAAAHGLRSPEDFNLITSRGSWASQTVEHIHVHYVPRRPGDDLALPWGKQHG